MGCSNSRSIAINSQETEIPDKNDNSGNDGYAHKGNVARDMRRVSVWSIAPEDNYEATIDEAVAFVQQELNLPLDRATRFVLSVDEDGNGFISSLELVQLSMRIQEIKSSILPEFLKHDSGGTGSVCIESAHKILCQVFPGVPLTTIKTIVGHYKQMDSNEIQFADFVEFYSCVKARKSQLEEKFLELDADNSGELESDELITVLMKECALTEAQARSLVDDFDYNKDGTIDKAEFFIMWTRLFSDQTYAP